MITVFLKSTKSSATDNAQCIYGCIIPLFPGKMHNSEASHDPPHTSWEQTELVHTHSKDRLGSPDTSGLGTPRCTTHFDLLNMVVSYKRMVQYLEPVADAVELGRFLLGFVSFDINLIMFFLSFQSQEYHISSQSDLFFFIYLNRWKMPVCSLLVCLLLNAFFCTVNEGKRRHRDHVSKYFKLIN